MSSNLRLRASMVLLASGAALSFAACADVGTAESVNEAQEAAVCPPATPVISGRSLFVTDATTMGKFSFQRVMNAIMSTGVVGAQTSLELYQQWWDLNNDEASGVNPANPHCDDNGGTINGFPIDCPRQEGALASTNPFPAGPNHYSPVGVVNRFDLAPSNGSHCGQYRVVFGKDSGKTNGADRNLIIFEAVLPNPTPSAGIAACLPVAQFWDDLSADGSVTSRAAKLETFFFTGIPGFAPVIHANHYGLVAPTGQIRTNQFMASTGGQNWELREYHLTRPCPTAGCKLQMRFSTVKTNPTGTLFSGTDAKSLSFQTAFLNQVPKLARATDPNGVAMTISNTFNAGESREQDNTSVYETRASASYKAQIQAKLTSIGSTLTTTQLLARATTQSCAGCHQTENGHDMGGFSWPSSNGFTQIDENKVKSSAVGVFLDHRAQVLEDFINKQCTGVAIAVDEESTIAGAPLDAAN